ncbi:MAG: hypothetical protein JWR16_1583 [Nevskia sp.]|nr:hypothetical protein [Nevskia sp.]
MRGGNAPSRTVYVDQESAVVEQSLPEWRSRSFDWTAGLTTRAANALRAHGFTSREQVAMLKDAALLHIAQIGPVTLAEIHRWLGKR